MEDIPAPAPAPAPAPPTVKKVDIQFNGKTVCKLEVAPNVNLDDAWKAFQLSHAAVTDKKGAFPTSFIGDLVNKHGCIQLPADMKCDEVKKFTI